MIKTRQLPLMILLMSSFCGYASAEQTSSAEVTSTEAKTEAKDPAQCKHAHLGKPDHLLANCAYSKSVHDYVIFFPIVGPLMDLAAIGGKYELKWWEIPLSVAIPFFGPGIARTNGTRICVSHMPHHGHGHEGHGEWKHE